LAAIWRWLVDAREAAVKGGASMKSVAECIRRALRRNPSTRHPAGAPRDEPDHVYHVRIEAAEIDGGYIAEVLELPGCASQGESVEETLENIVDALRAVLVARGAAGVNIPSPEVPDLASRPAGPAKVPLSVSFA
jgi:predicted RNase H-like HicB family nuclease